MEAHRQRPTSGMGRRTFCHALALGLAGAGLAGRGIAAAAPRLKIGVTGLIWGATPRTPENLAQALPCLLYTSDAADE